MDRSWDALGDLDDCEEGEEKESVKRQSRNKNEKKRRDQFNTLIKELSTMVSYHSRKLNKTSVLKSAIAYLRSHNELVQQSHVHGVQEDWKPSFLSNGEFTQLMLESLDSFLLVLTQTGTILYASESVTPLLGLLPVELVQKSVYDYVHSNDKLHLYQLLTSYDPSECDIMADHLIDPDNVEFKCHLVCGSQPGDSQPHYELVCCKGIFRQWNSSLTQATASADLLDSDAEVAMGPCGSDGTSQTEICFCCTVQIQSSLVIREIAMASDSTNQFTSRHSLEWKFLFLHHRGPLIIGYLPYEVLGTSVYDYYHPNDLKKVTECHKQLMRTGKAKLCCYRLLTKGQQWIWLQTNSYVTYHQWNSKPEFIFCTHKVVSYNEVQKYLRQQKEMDGSSSQQDGCGNMDHYADLSPPQGTEVSSSIPALTSQTVDDPDDGESQQDDVVTEGPSQDVPDPYEWKVCPAPSGSGIKAAADEAGMSQLQPVYEQSGLVDSMQAGLPQVETSDGIPPLIYMSPAQKKLHEQLQQKHQQLQQAILRQQQELKMISQHLILTSNLTMTNQLPALKEISDVGDDQPSSQSSQMPLGQHNMLSLPAAPVQPSEPAAPVQPSEPASPAQQPDNDPTQSDFTF